MGARLDVRDRHSGIPDKISRSSEAVSTGGPGETTSGRYHLSAQKMKDG